MKKILSYIRTAVRLSPILVCVVFSGCSQKERSIEGSTFVVLKNQDVKKLAGMQVNVLEKQSFIDKKKQQTPLFVEIKKKTETLKEKAAQELDWYKTKSFDADERRKLLFSNYIKIPYNGEGRKEAESSYYEANGHCEELLKGKKEKEDELNKIERFYAEEMHDEFRKMLFSAIQISNYSAKTDADGAYQILIPYKGEWILVAKAERLIMDKTEKYYWIVDVPQRTAKKDKVFGFIFLPWSKPPIDKIVLSNENMFSDNIDLSESDAK